MNCESANLVSRAQNGDSEAFTSLYRQCRDKLRAFIYSRVPEHAVDDIMQEVLIAALRKLNSFQGHSSFCSWLRGIAFNKTADYWRKNPPGRDVPLQVRSCDCDEGEHPEVEQIALEGFLARPEMAEARNAIMRECISLLDEIYREVISLRYIGNSDGVEMADWEIAVIINVSRGTIASRLSRGREMLGKCIKRRWDAFVAP